MEPASTRSHIDAHRARLPFEALSPLPGEPLSIEFQFRPLGGVNSIRFDLGLDSLVFGYKLSDGSYRPGLYIEQPNKLFDPARPIYDTLLQEDFLNPNLNREKIQVELRFESGEIPTFVPGSWHSLRAIISLDAQGDFVVEYELTTPAFSGRVTSHTPSHNASAFDVLETVFEGVTITVDAPPAGPKNLPFIEARFLDATGPRVRVPFQDLVEDPASAFGSHPKFRLPYLDDFSGYTPRKRLREWSYNPTKRLVIQKLSGMHTDLSLIELLDILPEDAPTKGVDQVILVGDGNNIIYAIVDNRPPESLNPNFGQSLPPSAIFRNIDTGISRYLDIVPPVSKPWDGVTPIIGQFRLQHDPRWKAGEFLSGHAALHPDPVDPDRGNVLAFQSERASGDAIIGDLDLALQGALPLALPRSGQEAVQAFDVFIPSPGPGEPPLQRIAWDLVAQRDAQSQSTSFPLLARIVFGGPHIFDDTLTFDDVTGAVLPIPDGKPDSFHFGAHQLDPMKIALAVSSSPLVSNIFSYNPAIYHQTDIDVPVNRWFRCEARVKKDGRWSISIDDGINTVSTFTGDPLTKLPESIRSVGLDAFVIQQGNDDGADGRPLLRPITWSELGPESPPQGGLDPLDIPAGPGSFNTTNKYFYMKVFLIEPSPNEMPRVVDVFVGDGTIVGTRPLIEGDLVVLWNNTATKAPGDVPGGPILTHSLLRNKKWIRTDEQGMILNRGFWGPLGIPGKEGVFNPAQNGGIQRSSPPYNVRLPFKDILMASVITLPPIGIVHEPFEIRFDNIYQNIEGCFGNIVTPADKSSPRIDGADLAYLIRHFGTQDRLSDLNGDGTTNGADLGLLLGGWGPCP